MSSAGGIRWCDGRLRPGAGTFALVGRGCDSDRYQAGPHLHQLVLGGENFHDCACVR